MAWGILIAAGGLEVFWATFMKLSEGFTKPLYTVLTFAGMAASFLPWPGPPAPCPWARPTPSGRASGPWGP